MQTGDDRSEIEALGEQYARAYQNSDLEAFLDCFDDDIVLMLTDRANVIGIEKLRDHQQDFFARFHATVNAQTEEIEVREELAFARGSLVLNLVPVVDGDHVVAKMSWMNIDRKSGDGRWRIWRSIYNYDESPRNTNDA